MLDSAGRRLIASRTIAHARLMTFRLAPGRYRLGSRIQHGTRLFAQSFTIRPGYTTRRHVIEAVP